MYTFEENALWSRLSAELAPLHARHACREILDASAVVRLPRDRIPSLREVTALVAPHTGFVLRPVAGLVPSRVFFAALADGVFLSTETLRDARTPHYTPAPDVVHEFLGHAASLAHPVIARLNRAIGRASLGCDDDMLALLERLYWFTLEFGLVLEDRAPKALGAGLLSSIAEIRRTEVELRELTLDAVARTPFSTDAMQDVLFVASSFDAMAAVIDEACSRARPSRSRCRISPRARRTA